MPHTTDPPHRVALEPEAKTFVPQTIVVPQTMVVPQTTDVESTMLTFPAASLATAGDRVDSAALSVHYSAAAPLTIDAAMLAPLSLK